jgi:hypothetical protein
MKGESYRNFNILLSDNHDDFMFLGDLHKAPNNRQSTLGQAVTLMTFSPDRYTSNLGVDDCCILSQSISASSRKILQIIPRSTRTILFPMHYLVITLPFY